VEAVWVNQLGGVTYRLGEQAPHEFVKWAPVGSGLDLRAEAARLEWAARYTNVPRVLNHGVTEGGEWLATAGIAGESAVSERWRAGPQIAVVSVGAGLRALHDALPVASCPFSWSAERRVDIALRNAADGQQRRREWHSSHRHLTVETALERLSTPPDLDRLVVCHGDACAPNTLIGSDGSWIGHVDLGTLGLADRWADLAVASWSVEWNFGPGWEQLLLDSYGVDADPDRTAYYRLLWDLA
jgi:kanamycin kinase